MAFDPNRKVGNVFSLKDFTAPKVYMGTHYECILTDQQIPNDARCDGDFFDKPCHISDYTREVYKPERFAHLSKSQTL